MHDESPKPTPSRSTSPQFGMRGLLIFTTGLCVLFAILAALRVAYWQMLLGFVATTAFSLLTIVLLEAYKNHDARRRGRSQRFPPPRSYGAGSAGTFGTAWRRGIQVDPASADPTGIAFVEPAGIQFVGERRAGTQTIPYDAESEGEPLLAALADENEAPEQERGEDAAQSLVHGDEKVGESASSASPQTSQSTDPPSFP